MVTMDGVSFAIGMRDRAYPTSTLRRIAPFCGRRRSENWGAQDAAIVKAAIGGSFGRNWSGRKRASARFGVAALVAVLSGGWHARRLPTPGLTTPGLTTPIRAP